MNDDARRKILERRAAFVAAAIASVAATSCERTDPCLSAVPTEMNKPSAPDATVTGTEAGPSVCLSEAPMPCLSPPLPPDAGMPHACLSKPRVK